MLAIVLAIAWRARSLLALRPPSILLDGGALRRRRDRRHLRVRGGIRPARRSRATSRGSRPIAGSRRHAAAYIANAVVICTWVPFVEELTYRGLGYSLLERFGRNWAILAVGILFGLAHGLVLTLPVIVAFGCALAWVRAKTDSVFPGMVLHALFNAVALVAAVTIGS